jgi:hypothetical protein
MARPAAPLMVKWSETDGISNLELLNQPEV